MKARILGIPADQIIVLLTLPVVVFLAFSAGRKILETYALKQEAAVIQAEIEQLKVRSADLRRQIEYLRSDAYVEKLAREELDLVKPGDVTFVVLYPPAQPATAPAQAKPAPSESPVPSVPWRDPVASPGR